MWTDGDTNVTALAELRVDNDCFCFLRHRVILRIHPQANSDITILI
jgi:hypothetical protein